MKKRFFTVCLTTVFLSNVAHSDGLLQTPSPGSGQFGANRRVITTEGFTGVRGSFVIPVIRIPRNFIKPIFVDPFNPAESKPTMYLGCRRSDAIDTLEVDAGLQYEPNFTRVGTDPNTGQPVDIPAGWGVFIATKMGGMELPDVNPAEYWKFGPGTGITTVHSIDLLWTMYALSPLRGGGYGGYLQVTARDLFGNPLPAADQPKDKDFGDNKIRAKSPNGGGGYQLVFAINGMRMKRVVGMTQGAKKTGENNLTFPINSTEKIYEEDGSYLKNAAFINGQLTAQNPTSAQESSYTPTQWATWTDTNTDNGSNASNWTGYYPGGLNKTITQFRAFPPYLPDPIEFKIGNGPGAKRIFEFPSIADSTQWDTALAARYANETININLDRFKPTVGRIVTPNSKFFDTQDD